MFSKGRKERCTPLAKATISTLAEWIREQRPTSTRILFPNVRGGRLSSDAVQYLVSKYSAIAGQMCPTLKSKRVTPHVLRHTAAMELLQGGADRAIIALWLGHESVETTQIYLDADLALKEQALKKATPIEARKLRFRPDDELLAFLKKALGRSILCRIVAGRIWPDCFQRKRSHRRFGMTEIRHNVEDHGAPDSLSRRHRPLS